MIPEKKGTEKGNRSCQGIHFSPLRNQDRERSGRKEARTPLVSRRWTGVRIPPQVPGEPNVGTSQPRAWLPLRGWSRGSCRPSVGAAGITAGGEPPTVLGTCTLSLAEECSPKGCADIPGARAGKPSCIGKDWTLAGLSIQEKPSYLLLKTEPPFRRRDLTLHLEGWYVLGKSYDRLELTFGYLASSTCPPHPHFPLAKRVMRKAFWFTQALLTWSPAPQHRMLPWAALKLCIHP